MDYLSPGVLVTLVQNQIVALPAVRVRLFSSSAAPAFQQSNSPTFADNVTVTLTDGMADLAGGFLRATAAGGAVVMVRRA